MVTDVNRGCERGSSASPSAQQDADIELIVGQPSKIADNHQVLAVETREARFQGKIAVVDLKLPNEIGGPGEDAPVILLGGGTTQPRGCRNL